MEARPLLLLLGLRLAVPLMPSMDAPSLQLLVLLGGAATSSAWDDASAGHLPKAYSPLLMLSQLSTL